MTAKQKANRERFKKVVAEAKKLRKKNPKLTQAQAVKQAWAIMYSKKRAGVGNVTLKKANYHKNDERYIIMNDGKAHLDGQPFFKKDAEMIAKSLRIVKKKRKEKSKVGAVKKKAKPTKVKAKKGKASGEMHTDTKSHNVNIRVMSGMTVNKNDVLKKIQNSLQFIELYEDKINFWKQVQPKNKTEKVLKLNELRGWNKLLKMEQENISKLKRQF